MFTKKSVKKIQNIPTIQEFFVFKHEISLIGNVKLKYNREVASPTFIVKNQGFETENPLIELVKVILYRLKHVINRVFESKELKQAC